jgi:hypothetical protein
MNTPKLLAAPAYLAAAAANIYTPAAATIFSVIRHIHVCNKTNAAATFTLYIDATGGSTAGKEMVKTLSVPAFSVWDWYGTLTMTSTQFLTGLCETGAANLTIMVEGEQGVV